MAGKAGTVREAGAEAGWVMGVTDSMRCRPECPLGLHHRHTARSQRLAVKGQDRVATAAYN